MLRMRVGSKDRWKTHVKGYVEIGGMKLVGYMGSAVVFARDVVSRAAVLLSRLCWADQAEDRCARGR